MVKFIQEEAKMVQFPAADKEMVDDYCHSLRSRFRNEVKDIILFGSQARGEGRPDSDIDLLIVLDTQDRRLKGEVLDLAWEAMSAHNFRAFLSPIVFLKKDYDQYRRSNSSFLANISEDAIRL